MFIVNSVIFSIFFVNDEGNHSPEVKYDFITLILGLILIPTIFYTGIKCDKSSPWTVLAS